MSNKTNASAQLNNYREIATAIKKSIEASGRIPPHNSVGSVLYRFLCTVIGTDVTLKSNSWSPTDWENAMTNASIKHTLTESEHVKWNNVQAAVDTLLSQIVFSNKDDIFGLFLKWIKSEKETSMYTPSGFLPHGIAETIKTHNESEKQKTFNLLRRVFKTNYDSTLIHIVNAMADQPSTEDTFVALSEKAMAELLKHEAENTKLRAINSSLTAANNNLRHNDSNNPNILKITKDSVFNRLKGLFPDNKAELIEELTDSFTNNKQTKNKYHVAEAAELFSKDVDIHHYKNQIECLLHETKVKSMKIVELEKQIADLHRKYTTPVITVGSVAPTTPKEPEFDSKAAIEHLRTLVTLQETRLQKLEQTKEPEVIKPSRTDTDKQIRNAILKTLAFAPYLSPSQLEEKVKELTKCPVVEYVYNFNELHSEGKISQTTYNIYYIDPDVEKHILSKVDTIINAHMAPPRMIDIITAVDESTALQRDRIVAYVNALSCKGIIVPANEPIFSKRTNSTRMKIADQEQVNKLLGK